jgi:hypothetical protein
VAGLVCFYFAEDEDPRQNVEKSILRDFPESTFVYHDRNQMIIELNHSDKSLGLQQNLWVEVRICSGNAGRRAPLPLDPGEAETSCFLG